MFPKSLENLSHATIVTGNRTSNLEHAKDFLMAQGIEVQGNSDVFVYDQESLGIDPVRDEIVRFVSSKKVTESRVVILSFDRATTEAQNALLKSIEEPQVGTYFLILVPNADSLLPTIRSRAQMIAGDAIAGITRLDATDFLKSNLAGRFALVESFVKNKKDEENLSKSEVIAFLDHVEKNLWEKGNRDEQLFADIRKMREYANIRGASHRVILDYIGMIAPVLR
ncbi:MAG: putative polymerase delta subunit [Patescibacteria group bacterium]|nr:putative polymerase delta subunit [Patescibacteria group bacterium]